MTDRDLEIREVALTLILPFVILGYIMVCLFYFPLEILRHTYFRFRVRGATHPSNN